MDLFSISWSCFWHVIFREINNPTLLRFIFRIIIIFFHFLVKHFIQYTLIWTLVTLHACIHRWRQLSMENNPKQSNRGGQKNQNKIEKLQSKTRKIDKELWQKLKKKHFYFFAKWKQKLLIAKQLQKFLGLFWPISRKLAWA